MKNVAVILAGGSGNRLGEDIPKQFLKIAGKKVIEHTLDVFQNHPLIDEIAVVSHLHYTRDVEDISIRNRYTKLKKILVGGSERYLSSLAAIEAYDDDANLIFHDSVRPLVNERIITDSIAALEKYNAVNVGIPTADTIIEINDRNEIENIPVRSLLRNGQSPQAFKRSVIKKAYDIALQDPGFKTTDDCGVVLKYLPDEPVYVVGGEIFNMKLTYVEDLFLLDKLFQLRTIKANSSEPNEEAFLNIPNKVMVVFGGSSGIGGEVVKLGRELGAIVYSFSRTENGVDVTNAGSVRKCLSDIYRRNGRIDYVVNTAGILIKEPLYGMSYQDIRESIDINLLGTTIVAKESYEYLRQTKGSLLFYTSSSYTRGRMLYSLYSATKAAIVNFVQALSEEWVIDKIRVNCINPERTKTPMRTRNFGNEPKETLMEPEAVAIASLNVLGSRATGEVIDVRR